MKRIRYRRRRMMRRRTTRSVIRLRKRGVFATRRSVRPRRGSRPEVKFKDISTYDQALITAYASTADANLVNSPYSHMLRNNVLQEITQGTGYFNRIGSRIFVKNIVMYTSFYLCPEGSLNKNYSSALVRYICASYTAAGTNDTITTFFGADTTEKMTTPLNRKKYVIHMDKRVPYNAGWAINRHSTGELINANAGTIKFKTFNIPVNRYVTFNQSGQPKEDYNIFSFAAFAQIPNLQSNTAQALCGQWFIRIYFTDA